MLANVNGMHAATAPELHLHCCSLRYRCALRTAAVCGLFCEDTEARRSRRAIFPLRVAALSPAMFLIASIIEIILGWLFTSFSFPHGASQIEYCYSDAFQHHDTASHLRPTVSSVL